MTARVHVVQHQPAAFPTGSMNQQQGLTKREWLAGLALQGLLAGDTQADMTYKDAAETAVAHADALLAELAK